MEAKSKEAFAKVTAITTKHTLIPLKKGNVDAHLDWLDKALIASFSGEAPCWIGPARGGGLRQMRRDSFRVIPHLRLRGRNFVGSLCLVIVEFAGNLLLPISGGVNVRALCNTTRARAPGCFTLILWFRLLWGGGSSCNVTDHKKKREVSSFECEE